MVCRMALSTSQILVAGVSLIIAGSPACAQSDKPPPADLRGSERSDPGLSAECLVPDTELFALAPLEVVKTALDEKRPVKILVLGSSAMSALGTGSASYPAWLEHELERLFPGSDFVMEHRALSSKVRTLRWHDLRRTHGCRLLQEERWSLEMARDQLGH